MPNFAGQRSRYCEAVSNGGLGRQRRRGVQRASDRSVSGVLEWIDAAEVSGRNWARNALAVVGVLLALLWLTFEICLIAE